MSDILDPGDAGCWIARGRPAHHAEALAAAWQAFPDLPNDAPLEDRMARSRERVAALRPLHDAITAETEAARQKTNFAFAEREVASGTSDPRYAVILRARDTLGHDWNAAYSYADGFHAARSGWDARFFGSGRSRDLEQRRQAYERGFRDGGGQPDDIFDTARRSYAAAADETSSPSVRPPATARILPSLWPNPTDAPAPVSWHRRLIILSAAEASSGAIGHIAQLQAMTGHDAAAIILADARNGLRLLQPGAAATTCADAEIDRLFATRDFDDILLAADDPDLDYVDSLAARLPIVRNMERTRNSAIQRRAQFRIWIARGRAPGTQPAAGHIRWGKVAKGLSGRLGEFTARYAGPAEPRGHRIIVEDASGALAHGVRSPRGEILEPEIVISSRARLRPAMTELLRHFAAGLRLG